VTEFAVLKCAPQAFELQRLQRLKEALLGSTIRFGKPRIIPAEDSTKDLESRIASLERGLGIDSRPTE
jgi:hypothetical protein